MVDICSSAIPGSDISTSLCNCALALLQGFGQLVTVTEHVQCIVVQHLEFNEEFCLNICLLHGNWVQKDFKKLYIGIVSFCLLTSQELEAEWSLFLEGGFEDCQCQCVMMKKLFVMALMIIRLVKIGWQWPTHKSANPAQDQGGGQPTNKTQNWNTSAKRGKN